MVVVVGRRAEKAAVRNPMVVAPVVAVLGPSSHLVEDHLEAVAAGHIHTRRRPHTPDRAAAVAEAARSNTKPLDRSLQLLVVAAAGEAAHQSADIRIQMRRSDAAQVRWTCSWPARSRHHHPWR